MMKKRAERANNFDWDHFIKLTKKRFRKKFKKSISTTEIKKIWDDFLEDVIERVLDGECVNIDRHSQIQVIGRPVMDDPRFMSLLMRGRTMRRNGTLKYAELSPMRRDFKYEIAYTNTLSKKPLYFKAHPKFAKRVHEAIENTNTYYKIES